MTSTTDTSLFYKMDCGSGKITGGEDAVPFFMREDGEEISNRRQKELECFLKCLETYPLNSVILRDKTLIFQDGGDEHSTWWLNRTTKNALMDFLLDKKNHKVNGEIWCNGFLGSRWADTKLNGRMCRLAFYTKKSDPDALKGMPEEVIKGKDYVIVIMVDYHY
jgi:hypothetical protein